MSQPNHESTSEEASGASASQPGSTSRPVEQVEVFERRFLEGGIVARPTGVMGWGLYAEREFLPGEAIFHISLIESDRVTIMPSHEAFGDCDERSANLLSGVGYCTHVDHPFWNVNHSCEGNSGFANWGRPEGGKIPFVAFRVIAAGEQITSDYSNFTTRYDGSPEGDPWELRGCLCGSANCRGTITGYHALPRDLQLAAIIPNAPPFGRVLAHILADEPDVAERLASYPMQYRAYCQALAETQQLARYWWRRFMPLRMHG